jgi:hypothetical protein
MKTFGRIRSTRDLKRTIGRSGIRIDGNYFFAPEMMAHLGETVLVKVSTNNTQIAFCSLRGSFLGVGLQAAISPSAPYETANTTQHPERLSFFSRLLDKNREAE